MTDHRKSKTVSRRRVGLTVALSAVAVVTSGSSISAQPAPAVEPVVDAAPAVVAQLSARDAAAEYLEIRASYTQGVASRSRRDWLVKNQAEEQAKLSAVRAAAVARGAAQAHSSKVTKADARKAKASKATKGTAKATSKAKAPKTAIPSMSYSRGNTLAIAAKLRGIRYRRGGTSPAMGFDCSGYTSYVFGKMGIQLPHTSDGQYALARKISKNQARPGDLVFWHGRGGVYHVAIYAGGGRIWHSPYPGRRVEKVAIWGGHVTYGRLR